MCRLKSAYYLEAGARTRALVPQRLNVRVFHSLLPRSVTPPDERPRTHGLAQFRRPCAGHSDVMSLGAQASVCSRSFLLQPQPRPIDDVYRWVRIDFGVRCLHTLRNSSMLSGKDQNGKAQKAARRSAPFIHLARCRWALEPVRICDALGTVRMCSSPC